MKLDEAIKQLRSHRDVLSESIGMMRFALGNPELCNSEHRRFVGELEHEVPTVTAIDTVIAKLAELRSGSVDSWRREKLAGSS